MLPSDLVYRHGVPNQYLELAISRFNRFFPARPPITANSNILPVEFAKLAYLLEPEGYEAIPVPFRETVERLLSTIPKLSAATTARKGPNSSVELGLPKRYIGRQNNLRYLDGAERYVSGYRADEDARIQELLRRYDINLHEIETRFLICEWNRLCGVEPNTEALDAAGRALEDTAREMVELEVVMALEEQNATLQKYALMAKMKKEQLKLKNKPPEPDEKHRDRDEPASKLPLGCVDLPANCPVRGLPPKLYRWQSFRPDNGINLPPGGEKGIPTASDGKAAYNMGAIDVQYLVEIDRDRLIAALGAVAVRAGYYGVSGSRVAGWEFKLWVKIPQAAITNIWAKRVAPRGHKPRSI